jgi:hypothetical protein
MEHVVRGEVMVERRRPTVEVRGEENSALRAARAVAGRVRLAPGWSATIEDFGYEPTMTLKQPGIAPNTESDDWDEMFPGGLDDMELPAEALLDPRAIAAEVVALTAAAAFHEALEWVDADGKQVADPHPLNEDASFVWLHREMRAVVDAYAARFPADREPQQ